MVDNIFTLIHPTKIKILSHSKYHTHTTTHHQPSLIPTPSSSHSTLVRPAINHISASDVHLHDVVEALAVHDGGGGADEDVGDEDDAQTP